MQSPGPGGRTRLGRPAGVPWSPERGNPLVAVSTVADGPAECCAQRWGVAVWEMMAWPLNWAEGMTWTISRSPGPHGTSCGLTHAVEALGTSGCHPREMPQRAGWVLAKRREGKPYPAIASDNLS